MRKLFLHVGYAKCGSTSLQEALSAAPNIVFPKSGNHGGEHLAFALTIRGIDDWTRQYVDAAWVECKQAGMIAEIEATTETVVLSSERLAAMSSEEIERLADMFGDFEVHIVFIRRDIQRYISSTWRHAVFRHDYGESYEAFVNHFKNFTFGDAETKFRRYFPVHSLDMEDPNYVEKIEQLLGTKVTISHSNVGVPMEFAKLLQMTHVLLGSEEFKKRFDSKTKRLMLDVWNGRATTEIESIDASLF